MAGVGGRLARGRVLATGGARRQGDKGGEGKARHLQVCASLPVPVASSSALNMLLHFINLTDIHKNRTAQPSLTLAQPRFVLWLK